MSEIRINEEDRDGVRAIAFSKVIKGEERVVVYQQDTATIGQLLDKAMLVFKRHENPLDRAKIEAQMQALREAN